MLTLYWKSFKMLFLNFYKHFPQYQPFIKRFLATPIPYIYSIDLNKTKLFIPVKFHVLYIKWACPKVHIQVKALYNFSGNFPSRRVLTTILFEGPIHLQKYLTSRKVNLLHIGERHFLKQRSNMLHTRRRLPYRVTNVGPSLTPTSSLLQNDTDIEKLSNQFSDSSDNTSEIFGKEAIVNILYTQAIKSHTEAFSFFEKMERQDTNACSKLAKLSAFLAASSACTPILHSIIIYIMFAYLFCLFAFFHILPYCTSNTYNRFPLYEAPDMWSAIYGFFMPIMHVFPVCYVPDVQNCNQKQLSVQVF